MKKINLWNMQDDFIKNYNEELAKRGVIDTPVIKKVEEVKEEEVFVEEVKPKRTTKKVVKKEGE